MKIVSNCPLCEEKSLHVIEEDEIGTQQCISCGFVTTNNFIGTKKDNDFFKTLPGEMKVWAKEANDRIWIPSMMTLPFGTLYPTNIDSEMKWGFAEMVDIPEEEQNNYPDGNGGFYKQKYDTDNAISFDTFFEAMIAVNQKAKHLNMHPVSTVTSDNG